MPKIMLLCLPAVGHAFPPCWGTSRNQKSLKSQHESPINQSNRYFLATVTMLLFRLKFANLELGRICLLSKSKFLKEAKPGMEGSTSECTAGQETARKLRISSTENFLMVIELNFCRKCCSQECLQEDLMDTVPFSTLTAGFTSKCSFALFLRRDH